MPFEYGLDDNEKVLNHKAEALLETLDTAKTAEEHGLRVDVLAEDSTPEGLAEALAAHGVVMRERAEEAGEDEWRPSKKRAAGRRKS